MSLHFHAADPTLPRRVMNALGLAKEWLDTNEAKEILFGEKVNYDAVGKMASSSISALPTVS